MEFVKWICTAVLALISGLIQQYLDKKELDRLAAVELELQKAQKDLKDAADEKERIAINAGLSDDDVSVKLRGIREQIRAKKRERLSR